MKGGEKGGYVVYIPDISSRSHPALTRQGDVVLMIASRLLHWQSTSVAAHPCSFTPMARHLPAHSGRFAWNWARAASWVAVALVDVVAVAAAAKVEVAVVVTMRVAVVKRSRR